MDITQTELDERIERHRLWTRGKGEGEKLVLRGADLHGADLVGADLRWADLRETDLSEAGLNWADLREANLSGAKGLLTPADFMATFETDDLGWIVYKSIGVTAYSTPSTWIIQEGSFLTENALSNREIPCGCGVNFGTRDWCDRNFSGVKLWKCRIRWEDGPGIVVPYNTSGKARCERLELIEIVND